MNAQQLLLAKTAACVQTVLGPIPVIALEQGMREQTVIRVCILYLKFKNILYTYHIYMSHNNTIVSILLTHLCLAFHKRDFSK